MTDYVAILCNFAKVSMCVLISLASNDPSDLINLCQNIHVHGFIFFCGVEMRNYIFNLDENVIVMRKRDVRLNQGDEGLCAYVK